MGPQTSPWIAPIGYSELKINLGWKRSIKWPYKDSNGIYEGNRMQKSRIFSFCYTKDLIICNVAKERNFLKCLTEFLLKLIFFCFLSVLLILMIFWPFLDINFMQTLLSKIIVSSYFPAMLRLNSILDSKKNVENWQAFKWNCFANKVKSSTTPEESSIAQIGAHFSNKTEYKHLELKMNSKRLSKIIVLALI